MYCLNLIGIESSGYSPWPCFRGSIFHTGQMDSDGDKIDDLTEEFYNTEPQNEDTDEDGLLDYDELFFYNTDPTDADTDDDGYTDGEEIAEGTDPKDPEDYPGATTTSPTPTNTTTEDPLIGGIVSVAIVVSVTITIMAIVRKRKRKM